MIKKGLIAAAILVAVSIVVLEQRKNHWSKAGSEIRDAATAVGHAISETPAETWDAAHRASGNVWEKTKQKSGEAWKKTKENIHEGVESIGGKKSG
ncbi:MAG TPA: hypothetical protein DDW45_07280 [Gammaproteobacteria bacterium]|nr:hypothetical protein [Gammaproteobacteria bacterium]